MRVKLFSSSLYFLLFGYLSGLLVVKGFMRFPRAYHLVCLDGGSNPDCMSLPAAL